MCLISKTGRTNSKNLRSFRPYRIGYKCGHCAECVKEKRNEWLLRSYFESKDTLDNNGYILFDTLTYDDDHLPHISKFFPQIYGTENDFSCFSYEDIRKFTNNLWVAINRLPRLENYDVKRNVKFFLVSEYGHEDDYVDDYGHTRKGTFRPHYHMLVYIKDRRLHPGTLARLIYHVWRRGETDNHKNGLVNLQKNVIGKGYTKDKVRNILAVSNYVSKYITKQGDFMEKVEQRIDFVTNTLIRDAEAQVYRDESLGRIDNTSYWNKRDEVLRYISPFHRQSRGFGICALKDENVVKTIIDDLNIVIPDSKYVTKVYNVPLYYMRKLFYRVITDDDGLYHWILNDLGKQEYPKIMNNRVSRNADRYYEWFQNLEPQYREFVIDLLDGRSWKDFSEYLTFYRGRLKNLKYMRVDEETGEVFKLPTIEEIIQFDIDYDPLEDTGLYSNGFNIVHHITTKDEWFRQDEDDFDDDFNDMIDDFFCSLYGEDWYDEYREESYSHFDRLNVINENSDFSFRDFDFLYNFYIWTNIDVNRDKQLVFDTREELIKKFKECGIKCNTF